ncbi:hypothetical protein B0T17DRAFT_593081 [Bombardia bombarda]|uniref:Zn(2)-C6 fungal-type domain-containing protein n=1 Tax=Bombardia bombarda TaxID=252184 RepID=A0AA39TUE0_9PEZI|nr:hypothetical protein B0T17DRAFT_593081 [Bombardia bombarda]
MVYGGKPSRGCRTCRTRRIKCDEGKPTCKRCEKSKRECGGYRPEFEIVHRDQTRSTERRVRKAIGWEDESLLPSTPPHSELQLLTPGSSSQRRKSSSASSSPSPVLTVPIAQRAACHFASNFILVSLGPSSHGFLEYLVPLIDSQPPGSALRFAFNACAFASFGNRMTADGVDIEKMALKEHTLALGRTHWALGNQATATQDATLAAVLLLGLYESITAKKEYRMLAWRTHIEGAVQIIKSRGREQMRQTKTGTLLFNAVRHQLLSRTLSSGTAPPLGVEWWMNGGDTDSLQAKSQGFALKASELRAEASRLMATSDRGPDSVEMLLEMARRTPEGGSWGDVAVFPGRVDVYPDFVTASTWNISRIVRLLLACLNIEIAAWLASPVDYRTTAEYATSKRICEDIIPDIIASVPYHLGWHTRRKEVFESSSPERSGFACGDDAPLKALPALFILWSLTMVKNHDMTRDDQRAWAKGRLRFVDEKAGLKYARMVNELQVDLHYPSMFIRKDGFLKTPDPFTRSKTLPLTPPESAYDSGSSPGSSLG